MSEFHPADFFVAGGPLRSDAPSYVVRPADEALYQAVQRGEFCYVLAAPQMGKSSLLVRTAHRLKAEGDQTAVISLSQISSAAANPWFSEVISTIAEKLGLDEDVAAWWQANATQDITHRFTTCLRDVVLPACEDDVVILVDDIDALLNLDFAHDFLTAVRAVYDSRSSDATLERLTFVLAGTAAPSAFGGDQTPPLFDISRRLELDDFRWRDMEILESGLEAVYPQAGHTILLHVYRWTRGHPYLTQKLCKAIVDTESPVWSNEQTDQVVNQFLRQEAPQENSVTFARNAILNQDSSQSLLNTYRRVLQGKKVADNEGSPVINQLKLAGLVRSERGYLHNRNEIYRYLFGEDWLKEHITIDWRLTAAIISGIIVLLLIIYLAVGWWQAGRADEAAVAALVTNTATPTGTTIASAVIANTLAPTATNTTAPTDTLATATAVTPTTAALTPTHTPIPPTPAPPTETPAPTAIPTAVAIQQAILFLAPDTNTQELDLVVSNETVEVLGRSADRFGRVENEPGLYVRKSNGIEGFAIAMFFDWPGNIEELPIVQPKLAIAIFNLYLTEKPDSVSERLAFVSEGQLVVVLARSGDEWLYVINANGVGGFAPRTYFDWRGDFEALPERSE